MVCVEQFATDQALLGEHLRQFLTEQVFLSNTALGVDVVRALEAPGKLLSPPLSTSTASTRIPAGVWALLPFYIARYCHPLADPALVSRVALVCECLLCALDLLDDLEDDDATLLRQELGDAPVCNTSTTLLFLAQTGLLSLAHHGVPSDQVLRLLSSVNEHVLLATRGQHQDLLDEGRTIDGIGLEECLIVAKEKAGSLVHLVCSLAATSVSAGQDLAMLFAEVGMEIGIAYQIDNDIHDLSNLIDPRSDRCQGTKSDLRRAKKTFPIVLADRLYTGSLQNAPLSTDRAERAEQERLLQGQAYKDAIKASIGLTVYYRRRAKELVRQIETLRGTPLPPALQFLLSIQDL